MRGLLAAVGGVCLIACAAALAPPARAAAAGPNSPPGGGAPTAAAAGATDPSWQAEQPEEGAAPDGGRFAVHLQSTLVEQANDGFRSPYSGPNSLYAKPNGRETFDLTLYLGARLWPGAELWVDPEVDQGFGLTGTLGLAGFPSGEAYKVGSKDPYLRLQRAFIRQTFELGGAGSATEADLNQFSGETSTNRLVLTVGKFSVADIFDTNAYAHDPRGDFLNWTVIDAGAFDYAADAWGYSAGAAAEWIRGRFTLRLGAFLLSNVPNSPSIDTRFDQVQTIGELEARPRILGLDGAVRITGFLSRARMAKLLDALRLGEAEGGSPELVPVRRYQGRPGISLDLEQAVAKGIGLFARAGAADGRFETYEFTDVDRSLSGGLSVSGMRWRRPDDVFGLAGVVNSASRDRLDYLAAGGLGVLVGDGRLPHPGDEKILETYYRAAVVKPLALSLDYQFIGNPAYNRDRGPVSVLAARVHVQY